MSASYTLARECTVRGAALLDERLPGWHEKIDLDDLELNDITRCVLGQLFTEPVTVPRWLSFGYSDASEMISTCRVPSFSSLTPAEWANGRVCISNYYAGKHLLGLDDGDIVPGTAAYYGFNTGDAPSGAHTSFDDLDAEWAERVRERQAPRVVTSEEMLELV